MPIGTQRTVQRLVAILAVFLVLAGTYTVLRLTSGPNARQIEADRLRGRITDARLAADSCFADVAEEEKRFRAYHDRVDSLRATVRTLESLDPDGVPADRYEAYLEAFDEYNVSVPVWEARADSLRAHSQECRARARGHNVLVDSLRRLIDSAEGTESH